MPIVAPSQAGDVLCEQAAKLDAEGVELIPIDILMGNPEKIRARLSPNGEYMSYVAPWEGVMNLWLKMPEGEDDRLLTQDTGQGIGMYYWSYNNEQIIFTQDADGDENHRVYAVDVSSGETELLTPADPDVDHPVQARILMDSPDYPDIMMIGLNKRDARVHDLYKLNIRTGDIGYIQEADPAQRYWLIDHDMEVRGYVRSEDDGGRTAMIRDDESGEFESILYWSADDGRGSGVWGFTPDNKGLYLVDSRERNAAALVEYDLETGESKVLASDPIYDVDDIEFHPGNHTAEAAIFIKDRQYYQVFDSSFNDGLKALHKFKDGDIDIVSRTVDDEKWMVAYVNDDGPIEYYIYDRTANDFTFVFVHQPALSDLPLVHMKPIEYTARDGLQIHGYLTLPMHWEGPGPMVMYVHGGPWSRTIWGLNSLGQMMANRGYAFLQIDFRGSSGYGKDFLNAGNREWGAAMQDDVSDGVQWAIDEGIAESDKVVIFGGSYGGYATLAGVTYSPELYAAGIALFGPSNMESFLNSTPPYWTTYRKEQDIRIGRLPRYEEGDREGEMKDEADWTDADKVDIDFLRSRSPLYFVDNVICPMQIFQGANDPRVVKAESDQFVEAMIARGLDVDYVVYENEGHGFRYPENRLDYMHRVDLFLARILDGRYEEYEIEVERSIPELPSEGERVEE